MFPLHDGWSVANLLGHEAFRYLGAAMKENLRIHSKYPDIEKINLYDGLSIGNEFRESQELEVKFCIHATVIFQSSMEAWINYAYEKEPLKSLPKQIESKNGIRERNFIEKWEHAFKKFNSDYDFSIYTEFYRKYRNAIVHPTNKKRVEIIEDLNSEKIIFAFENAWNAMAEVSHGFGQKFLGDHWGIMCNANNVPYIEFEKLKNSNENYKNIFRMYLDFLNKKKENII